MKIIVTGALGHIGSKLIRALPTAFPNHKIVMIDDMSTQRFASLFNLPKEGRYEFIESDLRKAPLKEIFRDARAVIHLAAITDAASSFANKDRVSTNNFECTAQVAEACASVGTPLLFLSTTSVYGTQNEEVDENCGPDELNPQSPYAETKLREESLLKEMAKLSGLKFIACRFGTIFGTSPGMRFHTAVNKFCWQAVMRQPITVWRTALNQVRPYLDLHDGVRAICFILERNMFDGETYNVLTLNATVADIVEILRSRLPDLVVTYVDQAIMNQLSYRVSSRKFEATGFRFEGNLKRACLETVELIVAASSR